MKFFLVLTALAVSAFSLSAQVRFTDWAKQRQRRFDRQPVTERFDLRLSVAGVPDHASDMFLHGHSWVFGVGYKYIDVMPAFGNGLSDMYADYHGPTRTAGTFGLGFDYAATRWLSISADIAATFFWHDNYEAISDRLIGRTTGAAVYLLPRAKFMYMNRRKVRLYGSLGAGMVKYINYDKLSYSYSTDYGVRFEDTSLRACAQVSPIGVEFGRKLFGFAELGVGSLYTGMQAGIGYKF